MIVVVMQSILFAINSTPVRVGGGQVLWHWSGESIADASYPICLCQDAPLAAFQDAGEANEMKRFTDKVVVVRTNADSVLGNRYPFDRCEYPSAKIADALDLYIEEGSRSEAGKRESSSSMGGWRISPTSVRYPKICRGRQFEGKHL